MPKSRVLLTAYRTLVCDNWIVKGSELLRNVKRFAHRKGLGYRWAPSRGAGSHGTVYLGERMTVVKDLKKELGRGLFRCMCRDLDLGPREL